MHAKHQLLLVVLLALAVKGSTAARPVDDKALRSLLTTTTPPPPACDAPADYCLVLDGSSSLGSDGFINVVKAANNVITATTNAGNRYYINQFNSALVPLMSGFDNKGKAQQYLNGATFGTGGNTNMKAGLADALVKFQTPGSPNSVKILFLITDGVWNVGGDPTDVLNQLKSLGVTVVTIGVGNGVDVNFLKAAATTPSKYFPVADTTALITAIYTIVATVCPMVCKPPQKFNLVADSTGSCSLPACSSAPAGAPCYNVYISGAAGTPVTQTPAGKTAGAPITVTGVAQTDITVDTVVKAEYAPASQSCTGVITITCETPGQCKYNGDCYKVLENNVTCGVPTCVANKCVYAPKMGGSYCDDGNPCTTNDKCDGKNYGPNACGGTAKSCTFSTPPVPSMRSCYDAPFCDTTDGKCVWPFTAKAVSEIVSANSYCGTWAGAFATQLVSNGTTPNPAGSTVYSLCSAACSASICAQATAPQCSCMTSAFSISFAQAGTCPPCPDTTEIGSTGVCKPCQNGVYTNPSDGSHPNATCWYPNSDVKNGQGGVLYPCPGSVYTEYVLTGGTATSQCMGCVALGTAYNKNTSSCYAGNLSIPVDP